MFPTLFSLLSQAVILNINHTVTNGKLEVNFTAFGSTYNLELDKNNFLSDQFNAFEISGDKMSIKDVDDCYFIAQNAAFRSCNGLSGLFFSDKLNTTIKVEPLGNSFNITRNVTIPSDSWCRIENTTNNSTFDIEGLIIKRDFTSATIEVLAIADHTMVKKYGNNTVQHVLDIVNIASSIYASNTFLVPVSISLNAIITLTSPIVESYVSDTLLDEVTAFVVDLLYKKYFSAPMFDYIRDVDHVSIFTSNAVPDDTSSESGFIIGIARLSSMCLSDSVSAISEYYTDKTPAVLGFALAHEIGHSMSALHDGQNNDCPSTGYVMAAYISNPPPHTFSSCSIAYINNMLIYQANNLWPSCVFQNSAKAINVTSLCGNGIVDFGNGEECDAAGDSPCCTTGCKLKQNAMCDDLNGSCCSNCQLLNSSSACRDKTNNPLIDSCDATPKTYCDGKSPYCPFNQYLPTWSVCDTNTDQGQGFCYEGYCFTRQASCINYGYTYGKCDKNNSCMVVCDNGSGCVDINLGMSPGTTCGAKLDGTCDRFSKCNKVNTTSIYSSSLTTNMLGSNNTRVGTGSSLSTDSFVFHSVTIKSSEVMDTPELIESLNSIDSLYLLESMKSINSIESIESMTHYTNSNNDTATVTLDLFSKGHITSALYSFMFLVNNLF